MALNTQTAVIGCAIAPSVDGDKQSLEELLYQVSQEALRNAGVSIEEIDGIVVGSNDQFDGRAISIMAASGSVGGVDRDILSTPSAGEHAFVMGVLRVASGLYRTQLIVSWSPTESSSLSEAQRLGADPYFHRKLPINEITTAAVQASVVSTRAPSLHASCVAIAENSRRKAMIAYPSAKLAPEPAASLPFPLSAGMAAGAVTGVVAVVVASKAFVDQRGIADPAWISGMGWATESGYLGDRDLGACPALEHAARQAFEEAGLSNPAEADVVELDSDTPYQELLIYEGLGLSKSAAWVNDVAARRFEGSGDIMVNPSGGPIAINPVFCTGLIRIAEAANQVRGKAGAHQVSGATTAIAHAASGFAMMYQTVVVLDARTQEARS